MTTINKFIGCSKGIATQQPERLQMTFLRNFVKCGTVGWCMEITFTALDSLRRREFNLKGVTSLWMFPIYGCAAFLKPIARLLHAAPTWFRGLSYMSLIFSAEYLSGTFLGKRGLCPWDYQHSRWNIKRYIRLDYAPFWFGAGLLFERVLIPRKKLPSTVSSSS